MKLYFSPLACSLATRIAFYEAGAEAKFVEIDSRTRMTDEGIDYRTIHPLGLVPALEIEPGQILTENAAILQFVAERYPAARLAPEDAFGRTRLREWLSFIGTELHKAVYQPLLDQQASAEVKAYALAKASPRLMLVARRLAGRQFLLDQFTVADAYLFAVLNWSKVTPVDLAPFPAIEAYQSALDRRPNVARAFAEELALYRGEMARRAQVVTTTAEVIDKFNRAFLRHDPALLDDLIAEDCVLENTGPAPDGARHVGRQACLGVWQGIARNEGAHFELENVEVRGEQSIVRWRYVWGDDRASSLRGVNIMYVREGRVVEGHGYVKGSS